MKKIACFISAVVLFAVLALTLSASAAPTSSAQDAANNGVAQVSETVTASGVCGKNAAWVLTADGTLIISGEGEMKSYNRNSVPWKDYRSSILKIVVEDGIISIGEYAFFKCENATSVSLPDSITSICRSAFCECNSLLSVTIPVGVNELGDWAFAWCENLTEVYIPDSVTKIGAAAFAVCEKLQTVTMSTSITEIADDTFFACSALSSVVIPDGVTSIGEHAFWCCHELSMVSFPDSLTTIGEYAFGYCYNMEGTLVISDQVTTISDGAFINCFKVCCVSIGKSVSDIAPGAFNGCVKFEKFIINPENLRFTVKDGILFNKEKTELICCPQGKLGTDYEVPSSVTKICNNAFWGCKQLVNLTIPDSVTTLDDYAITNCSELKSVAIGSGVTSIGEMSLSFNKVLGKISVSESNPAYLIQDGVLFNKEKTVLVLYPGCKTEKSYDIPASVNSIGSYAFDGCDYLKEMTIPEGVISIGEYAFYFCQKLEKVTLPTTLTSIGESAFQRCDSLTDIVIPAGVTTLSKGVFAGCGELANVVIEEGVTTIETSAFGGCAITSIRIPDSVAEIKWSAFNDCDNLVRVIIGAGVTTIGEEVFNCCSNLTDIYYIGTEEQWGQITIDSENEEFFAAAIHFDYADATVTVSARPVASEAKFAADLTLSEIALSGGTITNAAGEPISGTWSWAEPETVLYAGTASYKAVFTPASSAFVSITADINVIISAAEQTLASIHATPEKICTAFAGPGLEMKDMVSSNLDVQPVFAITKDEGEAYVEGTVLYSPDAGFVTVEARYPAVDVNGDGINEYNACSIEIHTKFTTVPMFRMYDPNSGEHFYTGSMEEVKILVVEGWKEEGVAFNHPALGAPVYRLYNPVSGDHLYTMDQDEIAHLKAEGWNVEGVAFNSAADTEVAQYRLWNPNAERGAWHFTSDAGERDYLISLGWQYQGIGWYSSAA